MKRLMIVLSLVILLLIVAWQLFLYQKLSTNQISCSGDWSYAVKCPVGTFCKSLKQGPFVGGICSPYLLPVTTK